MLELGDRSGKSRKVLLGGVRVVGGVGTDGRVRTTRAQRRARQGARPRDRQERAVSQTRARPTRASSPVRVITPAATRLHGFLPCSLVRTAAPGLSGPELQSCGRTEPRRRDGGTGSLRAGGHDLAPWAAGGGAACRLRARLWGLAPGSANPGPQTLTTGPWGLWDSPVFSAVRC